MSPSSAVLALDRLLEAVHAPVSRVAAVAANVDVLVASLPLGPVSTHLLLLLVRVQQTVDPVGGGRVPSKLSSQIFSPRPLAFAKHLVQRREHCILQSDDESSVQYGLQQPRRIGLLRLELVSDPSGFLQVEKGIPLHLQA